MKKLFSIASICAAVVIAASVAAPAAKATTVTATWTGTITNGQDYGGNFGAGFGASDPVVLTTVFDTALGTYDGNNTITGGGSATLKIGTNSYTFSLPTQSYSLNGFGSLVMDMSDGLGGILHTSFWSPAMPGAIPPSPAGSILTSFDGDTAPGYSFGTFQIVPGYTAGNFDISHLTVAVSATPIPAALPLFASALLGLGAVGWRRRKAAMSA